MNSNPKLSYAIAAILSSAGPGLAHAAAAADAADTSLDSIQEITVTAQRRSESIQNVPITIQALTAETLNQLSVETFDDYVRYLPNVTAPTNGPGQGNIFMRGLSVGSAGSQSSGSIGGFPNVAIYLDDQSGQLPARNLDVYAADLERIEVLEGPQGTLFGAGAQAGVVRYITNKPKLNTTEANFEAGYGITAGGDPNTDLSAVINLPLISDTLAVRALIYSDRRGGYIDNVPGTFTRKDTDLGIYYAHNPGGGVPAGSPSINNNAIAGNNINPVTYTGTRVEALYQINDDWNVLVSQSYQNMDSEGVFYQMPDASDGAQLKPLEVTLFNNSYDKDKFENTAWTLNGKIGPIKAVYTGGYLVRHVDQVGDYTNYARGVYADYYQCYGPGTGYAVNGGAGDPNLKSTCFSPSTTWRETERNEHLSNEFRFSTPDDWRTRGIVGAFFENNTLFDQTDWLYRTVPTCTSNAAPGDLGNSGCFTNVGTVPGTSVENPGQQNDNVAFFEDTTRQVKQTAFFGSIDFDIIPKVLTITAGTRHYNFDEYFRGSVASSFYCFEQGIIAGGCLNDSTNLNAKDLSTKESGFKSRGNITWHVTPDVMIYATWSQGFRPGGFNRTGGSYINGATCAGSSHIKGPDLLNQFCIPQTYQSDDLTNKEIGWKTEFMDHRFQWNGALYQENWNNVQTGFFDPGETGNLTFGTNGQDFRIRGIETSVVAVVLPGLTVQAASAWNQSEQTNSPSLMDTNPASVNFGKPITEACGGTPGHVTCSPLNNLFGPIGGPSANSPPIQFNARIRYEWSASDYNYFVQAGATHQGHSFSQAGSNPSLSASGVNTTVLRFENPAYSTFDASVGVAKDKWTAHIYGQNLANSNASVFTNTGQFVVAQTVLRPRVLGIKFGYKF
ncbi:MAG TPA: TonB-dependent receptor [Steroidobacteraceae bacterium]|nr:TonB-dependent receptor [Steroidobacteraceae bacterium]